MKNALGLSLSFNFVGGCWPTILVFIFRYVLPFHSCVRDYLAACDNATLDLWTQGASNFMRDLEDALDGCNSDVCDGKDCGFNGECRSLVNQYSPAFKINL